MNTSDELKYLQNFADKFNLKVKLFFSQDRRKKHKYVLTDQDIFVSPVLNYNEMNHFLLGIKSAINNNFKSI